jgi:predicted metal-binding membrane protein
MVKAESRRTSVSPVVPAIAAAATLGLAAACWVVTAWLMNGMDMGVASRPGSFGFFAAAWVTMMAAMMLPGAAPAVARHARARGRVDAALAFAGCYLAIWAIAGLAAYGLDRPHGAVAAGAVVVAAGAYELTPVKRHFRRRCREETDSGLGFGLCCIGSSVGLMAILVALDVMSLPWMAVITVLACTQKLLPPKAVIDVPVALALIGLGLVIILAPAQVPGLTPPAM